MRKMFLLNDRHYYNYGHKEVEVYLLSDLKKYPNLKKNEYNYLVSNFKRHNKRFPKNPIIGYIHDIESTPDNPIFVQVFSNEMEE